MRLNEVLNSLKNLDESSAARRDEIYRQTFGDEVWLEKYFYLNGADHLKNIVEVIPEKKWEILAVTLGNHTWVAENSHLFTLHSLKGFAKKFPEMKSKLWEQTVDNTSWLTKNISTIKDLKTAVKIFPERQSELFLKTVGNKTWFKKNITCGTEVLDVRDIFPDNKLLQNNWMTGVLEERLAVYHEQRASLINTSMTLFHGSHQTQCQFFKLPAELVQKVSCLSLDSEWMEDTEKNALIRGTIDSCEQLRK